MADLRSIQRVPDGLLQLLGMVGTGQNPDLLSGEIRGVLEVAQMLQLRGVDTEASAFVTGASGVQALLTVPDGEYWAVTQVMGIARIDGLAGVYLDCCIQARQGRPGLGLLTFAREQLVLGGGAALPDNFVLHCGAVLPYVLLIPPGGALAAVAREVGNGSCDVAVQAVFARLR